MDAFPEYTEVGYVENFIGVHFGVRYCLYDVVDVEKEEGGGEGAALRYTMCDGFHF